MECLKCSYNAPTNQAYDRHVLSKKHLQDKPDYKCYTCDYLAKTKQSYERHQAVDCHKPIVFSCEPCSYTTMSRQAFTTHTKSKKHIEGRVKPDYTCQKCFYVAKTKQRYERHQAVDCTTKEPIIYTCIPCTYSSKSKQDYNDHLLTKKHSRGGIKTDYTCQKCFYVATTKQAYERHQAVDCMTKEPIIYTCIPCEYSSKSKQDYDDHLLTQVHCKIFTIVKVKEIPSPAYLLAKYHKSAVKMGLNYIGYRRLSYHSKYIIYKNELVSQDDYMTAYQDLETLMKQEEGYEAKYRRYAYVKNRLSPDLTYPFSM